jgi:general secretion pathway protein K
MKKLKEFYQKSSIGNNRGVALLMAMASVVFIIYLVNEVSFESNVEYIVYSQSVNRLKAYYAARSGVELSLLRIKVYQQIKNQFGKQLGDQAGMLDMIWSLPIAWPPVFPDDLSAVDKDMIRKVQKSSTMEAQFLTTIEDEGSKIDVNDLNSPSKGLQESTKNQLVTLIENKLQNDEKWREKNRDIRAEEIINNISDWMSSKRGSSNGGGDKTSLYKDSDANLPPNRGFRTTGEVRLVADMTEDIFELLEPRITVYGMKGINPNTAPGDVLLSLDPSITNEIVKDTINRRNNPDAGGPFKDANDFWGFLESKGARLPDEIENKIPLIFNDVMSFKIKSSGQFGNANAEITAIVYDINNITNRLFETVKKEELQNKPQDPGAPPPGAGTPPGGQNANNGQNQGQTPGQQGPGDSTKGPPRIVYWNER